MRRAALLLAAGPLLAGCGSITSSTGGAGLQVVATVTQVSALVRAVGGDRVHLTALLTPNDDPHAYEPRPADVTALAGAKLVVKSGAGLDAWVDRSVTAAAPKATVLDLSKDVSLRGADPHWWYDVDNAKKAVDAIATEMGKLDPASRDAYQANARAVKLSLDAADIKVHGLIDVIPREMRLFVGNHDAFNYFLARYDITLVGDIIPSTDSLAAVRPADTAKLIADIKANHVRAIFTETTLSSSLVQQIATESGAKVFDGKLYGDAIGEPGTDGGTLEGAILHNGQLMAQAFGG